MIGKLQIILGLLNYSQIIMFLNLSFLINPINIFIYNYYLLIYQVFNYFIRM